MRGTQAVLGQRSGPAGGAGPQGQAESPEGPLSQAEVRARSHLSPSLSGWLPGGPLLQDRPKPSFSSGAPAVELARAAAAPSGRNAEVNGGSGVEGLMSRERAGGPPVLFRWEGAGNDQSPGVYEPGGAAAEPRGHGSGLALGS